MGNLILLKHFRWLGFRDLGALHLNQRMIVAGGSTAFVFGVYFYTMRAVGGTGELQVAIDKFEGDKVQKAEGIMPSKALQQCFHLQASLARHRYPNVCSSSLPDLKYLGQSYRSQLLLCFSHQASPFPY